MPSILYSSTTNQLPPANPNAPSPLTNQPFSDIQSAPSSPINQPSWAIPEVNNCLDPCLYWSSSKGACTYDVCKFFLFYLPPLSPLVTTFTQLPFLSFWGTPLPPTCADIICTCPQSVNARMPPLPAAGITRSGSSAGVSSLVPSVCPRSWLAIKKAPPHTITKNVLSPCPRPRFSFFSSSLSSMQFLSSLLHPYHRSCNE